MKHTYTYLALGDSYTIGESVALHEGFPYQAVQLLRKSGLHFHAPEVVAKTGWTSFELAEHILHHTLQESYDFVSLLIGVNNQYRGLPAADFSADLNFLIKKAIHLTGERPDHVILLSIPDWGATPFATGKKVEAISSEIDTFNTICESAAKINAVHYSNITGETRKATKDNSLLAKDQLHYSGKEYAIWAEKITAIIQAQIHK